MSVSASYFSDTIPCGLRDHGIGTVELHTPTDERLSTNISNPRTRDNLYYRHAGGGRESELSSSSELAQFDEHSISTTCRAKFIVERAHSNSTFTLCLGRFNRRVKVWQNPPTPNYLSTHFLEHDF